MFDQFKPILGVSGHARHKERNCASDTWFTSAASCRVRIEASSYDTSRLQNSPLAQKLGKAKTHTSKTGAQNACSTMQR
eukprot:2929041-Amphidinium_carterae.1